MKRLVILFALFFTGISAFAYGEESIGQKTNTEAGRYEIIIPDNMIRYTFRLDKSTGDIWQLVKNSDDSSTWQKVYREPSYFDSTDEDKINYQLIYKIPCSGVISRPAASTSCRSFFITSAGIHLRSTLTVRTRLRLRTMSIGA